MGISQKEIPLPKNRTDAASLAITFFIGVAVGSPIIASFVEKYCDRIYAMSALGVMGAVVFSNASAGFDGGGGGGGGGGPRR